MTQETSPASDPITMEVVRNKLDGIANEMQSTLLRSSFSPIVKEGLDASASLFTLEGETLAQATAIPIHLATLIPVVRTVIGKFPVTDMHEGDVYIMNDPYRGGTHLRTSPSSCRSSPADGHRVQRRDDPPPGRGRHVAGLGPDERDRDLPGRDPHPTPQVPESRRGQPDPGRYAYPQRAGCRRRSWAISTPRWRRARSGRAASASWPNATGRTTCPRSRGSCWPVRSGSRGRPSSASRTGATATWTGSTTTGSRSTRKCGSR